MSNMNYRRLHVTEALREAGIPLCFDAIIARGGLLKPYSRWGISDK